jgi:predicted Zn-ribbon and HTH transcriptional regulator
LARVPITVMGYHCDRCGHEWIPRGDSTKEPRTCPKCRSPYWNQPRKHAVPMSYDAFKEAVREVLAEKSTGLTWTEVRTLARLPQAFPNNKWVHRLESDIALSRSRDVHGIMHWTLGG